MIRVTIIVFLTLMINSKMVSQEIAPAPKNKAVVYFARTSGLGAIVNFSYFDSVTAIAKGNGTNYFRYECEPGPHLFWARSENIDYLEAELEAEKIYFVEVVPKMGIVKAEVELKPVDPSNEKTMARIFKLINKKSPQSTTAEKLDKEIEKTQNTVKETLEKYQKEKDKGKKFDRLEKTMYYLPKSQ